MSRRGAAELTGYETGCRRREQRPRRHCIQVCERRRAPDHSVSDCRLSQNHVCLHRLSPFSLRFSQCHVLQRRECDRHMITRGLRGRAGPSPTLACAGEMYQVVCHRGIAPVAVRGEEWLNVTGHVTANELYTLERREQRGSGREERGER